MASRSPDSQKRVELVALLNGMVAWHANEKLAAALPKLPPRHASYSPVYGELADRRQQRKPGVTTKADSLLHHLAECLVAAGAALNSPASIMRHRLAPLASYVAWDNPASFSTFNCQAGINACARLRCCILECRIIPPPVPRRRSIISSRPRGAGGDFAFEGHVRLTGRPRLSRGSCARAASARARRREYRRVARRRKYTSYARAAARGPPIRRIQTVCPATLLSLSIRCARSSNQLLDR